jgi:putative acetyltransferase
MEIRVDDLTGAEIIALLEEHLANMHVHSPPESVHALPIEKLRGPDITFWSVWDNEKLLGCGALKELDSGHGEIKSMRTVTRHLRKGVAQAVLNHIVAQAKQRGYRRLSLETGSMAAFEPARRLYERAGFSYCEPFGDYMEDPNSAFMTMEI